MLLPVKVFVDLYPEVFYGILRLKFHAIKYHWNATQFYFSSSPHDHQVGFLQVYCKPISVEPLYCRVSIFLNWSTFMVSLTFVPPWYKVVSSAYMFTELVFMALGISFTNRINMRGPKMEPWGTPSFGISQDDDDSPQFVKNYFGAGFFFLATISLWWGDVEARM